jgi:AcrR family transcriptional regulator
MTSFIEKQNRVKKQIVHDVVFDAALKILSRVQTGNLKIKDVAAQADISIGTIYNYFKNKEDLLYFLDGRFKELAVNVINQRAHDDDLAAVRLKKMIEDFFFFCEKHYVIFDLTDRFRIVEKRPADEKKQKLSEALDGIKKILDDGVKEKNFIFDDTASAARLLFSAMVGNLEINKNLGMLEFSKTADQFLQDIKLLLNNTNQKI